MKIKILFPTIILLSFVWASCSSKEKQKTDDFIPVKVMELKKENLNRVINVSGIFTTNDETYLSFKTGGIVKSIFVNEGDKIKKGQLLAVLELNEIEAQVSQAKSGYEKALRDFNRVQNLYKDSVATLAQMEDAKTGLNIATEQLTIAKYNLNHSEIRATDNGFVLKKFVSEGQLVNSGMPVFQTNGAVNSDWVLKTGISDQDWAIVKIGDKAIVKSDVDSSKNIEAVVLRKSEGVDPYTGTFSVELKLKDNSTGKIASGLFGKAKILPKDDLQIWKLPYQAILDGDGNTGFVFATNDLKVCNKTKVNILALEKDSVYISSGLDDYKYLIVSGSAYLNDNSNIKVDKQ